MQPLASKSAFVTGGAGFIGIRLVRQLATLFETVTVYDNLHEQVHGKNAAVPDLPSNAHFVKGDVRDRASFLAAIDQADPDVVVHLAAETGTGQSYDEVARYCEVNVTGTAFLVEGLRTLPSRRRRIVLASSRAVYGEGAYRNKAGTIVVPQPRLVEDMKAGKFLPVDAEGVALTPVPTEESLPPTPGSIYASTKLMQEYLLQQALNGLDIDLAVLRFQNVYGPGQSLKNPYTGVLSIFSSQILGGKTLNIYEDGLIARDFIFVDDVVAALGRAVQLPQAPKGAINIGSGHPATIIEVARELLRLYGRDQESLVVTGNFRAGDIRHAVADITRARQELGWEPKISLQDGLAALARWVEGENGVTAA